ncbi:cytochrome P450 [Xylariales sp. AK1849]|nr:cytochrome P450 [Xylariales sp. AK1849]
MAPVHVGHISTSNLALIGVTLVVTYYVSIVLYNLLLHPLRSFPGPIAYRASTIPRAYLLARGTLAYHVADLHRQYGSVVRLSPNELVFSSPQAWKDIYGHKLAGQQEFPKPRAFYRPEDDQPPSVISADREDHSRIRRQLSHGFSDRSMRGQEPIIGGYVDLLIKKLHSSSAGGTKPLNMREWLNWTTFDVIGDLGFGSSFGMLETSNYHPWVKMINDSIKVSGYIQALQWVGLRPLVQWIARRGFLKSRDQHRALTKQKILQRIELGAERPDLIEGLISKKDDFHMSVDDISQNANTLIIAGSETTATLLSGAIFLLTTHPECLKTLTEEVRTSFKHDSEITLTSVGNLHYMLAVLNETLRRYPPVGSGLPREAPPGGGMVAGHFVPEGVVTTVWQWPVNHDPSYWTDPMEFHPERFLGDPRYKTDQVDAMQPFSLGPRNCIGKNLAYAEMRLILAKIVFNFDMKIADESRGWLEGQKLFVLWDKPPLDIYLTPVAH